MLDNDKDAAMGSKMSHRWASAGAVCAAVLALAACSGNYDGSAQGTGAPGGGQGQARNVGEHFSFNVQPAIAFCRSCHVPGGIGDTDDGRDFMLGSNPANDLSNLEASWERLGGNNPVSRILLMASGQETPHSGGAPWPQGGTHYRNMDILLACFADPDGCAARLAGANLPTSDHPLLGSRRGGHPWFEFCEGAPDSAVLPTDPRSLVREGVNQDRAVYFNAWWRDCHADPELVGEDAEPRTCGELRTATEEGRRLIEGNGAIGAG
jgi:hypothetical protein